MRNVECGWCFDGRANEKIKTKNAIRMTLWLEITEAIAPICSKMLFVDGSKIQSNANANAIQTKTNQIQMK